MQREALEYVKKCDQCQRFALSIHQLGGVLNPLSSPWPFAQWGLDIVGPFPKAAGNKRYMLSTQITSINGSKPSYWLTSETQMRKDFSGETSLHDSGSLGSLS